MKNRTKSIKILFTAIAIVIINPFLFAQSTEQYDSTYTDNSYTTSSSFKNLYQYNTEDFQNGNESYSFNNESRKWIGSSKSVSTYFEGNTSYSATYYKWNSETENWGEHYEKREYEVNGGETASVTYIWDSDSQNWILSSSSKTKSYIEYNDSDQTTLLISYTWDEESNDWVNNYKNEYEYDEKGNQTLINFHQWDIPSTHWQPWVKYISSYDSQNNKTSWDYYSADENNQLSKTFEYTYENSYDENNSLIEVIATIQYITIDYSSTTKEILLYDENNNKTEAVKYNWSNENNIWTINSRQTFFTKDVAQTFNKISPSNFGINQGTLFEIPVLEKPVAASRVWKYKKDGESTFSSFAPSQTNKTLSTTFNESGDYEIICESTIEENVYTSNIVNLKIVRIGIAPTPTQNIEINQLGNTLLVSESPKTDSRYWHYSKTSGGPYTNSYKSTENHTPQFSEPGTYYVVCQSKWDNALVVSNEVIINVSGSKLKSSKTQLLKTNEIGESISILEYPISTNREWKYKTSETGIWKSFSPQITTADYPPSFSTIGEYFVACFSTFETETIMSDMVKIWVVEHNKIDPIAEQTIDVLINGTELNVTEIPTADSRSWYYSKTIEEYKTNTYTSTTNYTPNFNEPGVYYIVCKSKYDGLTLISNPVKINVAGNSVSPSDNQSYVIENTGNTLKVTENNDATSREWKYKTTEGGGWQSFSPIQDTTFLTPSFSELGTYFVACFSNINSINYTSNEVGIRVIDVNYITPDEPQSINLNEDADILTVSENSVADSRYWYYSNTQGGDYKNTYKSTTTYQPNFSESGTYYIVCKSKWDNRIVTSNEVIIIVNGYGGVNFQNSISPTNDQTIDINTNGTDLIVLESPDADSRYWYYSKGEANNFNNNTYKIEPTYTPKFSSLGVYYVICKSKLDTLYFESNPVKIAVRGNKISSTSSQNLVVSHNGKGLSVTEYPIASSREWKYMLTSEGSWQSFDTPETETIYTPNFSVSGEYYIACFSIIDGKTYETDDVRIRASDNNINPTVTQNINPNSDGNILTVNETYTSTNREWYASTVSGKEYFNYLGEGSTYIPNISEAGVYYIVCKSIWSNGFVYSNEVQVNVAGNNILPANDQLINPNADGTSLTVSEYPTATSREWKYKTSEGGTWTSFEVAETTDSHTPNFSASGTYYTACFSVIEGNSYTSNEVLVTATSNSIAPTSDQSIPVDTDGTQLSVTESIVADSRGWYYSSVSGSDYDNYLGDGTTYTPNFPTVGEYFIVCKSTWGTTSSTSNEVQVNVAGNNILPANDQVTAVNADGTSLTVSEYPTATSREWKYKTSEGGTWTSFEVAETTDSHTPNFSASGTYYTACFSVIEGNSYTSNEVLVTATSNSIAPTSDQSIPVDTDGTQLSVTESIVADSRGWYYSSVSGSDYDNYLGDGTTYTPNFPTVGEYFIVCKSTWGTTSSTSNEVQVNVAGNNILPANDQVTAVNADGTSLTVSEYPTATSREWKYKTSEGGTWTSFEVAETTDSHTPNFSASGTYYTACFSVIEGNSYTSNEVLVTATSNSIAPTSDQSIPVDTDGTQLSVTESIVADSRGWYYSSASGSDYDNYLGDGTTYTPNFPTVGEYFIVCKSTWGTTSSTSNEVQVNVAGNNILPANDQVTAVNADGTSLTVSEYPTATSREWKYKTSEGGTWTSFEVAETTDSHTPNFSASGTYYTACFSVIEGNSYTSNEVLVTAASNSIAPTSDQSIPVDTDGTQLSVTESIVADSRGWYYSSASGSDYDNYLGDGTTYTPNFPTVGEYFIVCKSTWGTTSSTSNEARVAVAGNNISPVTDQVTAVNADGTSLTVSEYPTATSREWKYKTSEGGTWTSFEVAETTDSHTPNFSASGTYYTACFSVIEGNSYTSNEVLVTAASNSIAPTSDQSIPVDTDGTQLSVTESIVADSRGWYYSSVSGNDYDNYLGDGTTYTPNFPTVGEYFIVCQSTWGTTSSTSNEVFISATIITSIKQVKHNEIQVFPNPSNGNFNIFTLNKVKEIAIYSIAGKLIYFDNELKHDEIMLTITNKGMHTLVIKTKNGGIITDKIIIY